MNDGALWLLTEEGTKVVSSRVLACCTAHVKIRRKRVWAGWIQAAVARMRMEKRQKSIGGEGFQIVCCWATGRNSDQYS